MLFRSAFIVTRTVIWPFKRIQLTGITTKSRIYGYLLCLEAFWRCVGAYVECSLEAVSVGDKNETRSERPLNAPHVLVLMAEAPG